MELYHRLKNKEDRLFSYFTMEIGLKPEIKTYSGGLGVLAGDTVKSFADKSVPMVCVTLLNENGYFKQEIDDEGNQIETDDFWEKKKELTKLDTAVEVKIEDRVVKVGAWEYQVKSEDNDYLVPVYFLDTDIEGNSEYDRTLTKNLYGGDEYYRLCQEIVLGIGGVRFLQKRGYNKLLRYHMNEGHAAFLTLELLRQLEDRKKVKKKCVFTTHTPVKSGHDVFQKEMVNIALGDFVPNDMYQGEKLSMTYLGFSLSNYINGVAKKHQEVTHKMFPNFNIDYITNGVHSKTWVSPHFKKLYDEKIPSWKKDPFVLRYAVQISSLDLWEAHIKAKFDLNKLIKKRKGIDFDEEVFTIGFARRATSYKRMDLLFQDIERLNKIAEKHGKIQLVFAGKAHPKDVEGKTLIKEIIHKKDKLNNKIKLVFLENYNMALAKKLISGVDVWLNTPKKPLEASGTSGMKAALNGIPSFSVLDGWWIEGHMEGFTGWSIGYSDEPSENKADAEDIYSKLENVILPKYYKNKDDFIQIMKQSIAFNGSFFNTNRMVSQYITNAYLK
ncbi:MAG: alpha-glucan family phosphorylase [Candidatus Woesearchaeota archaeon]